MRKSQIISRRVAFVFAALMFTAIGTAFAADIPEDLKCMVCGKPASSDFSVDWNGGKVYLACPNCEASFAGDKKSYAPMANIQLIATRQTKQIACPLTGKKASAAITVAIKGVKVRFCCNNCKGKVANLKEKEQLKLVFSNEAFKKAYKVTAADIAE
jgi:transcription elongation factor Elf1